MYQRLSNLTYYWWWWSVLTSGNRLNLKLKYFEFSTNLGNRNQNPPRMKNLSPNQGWIFNLNAPLCFLVLHKRASGCVVAWQLWWSQITLSRVTDPLNFWHPFSFWARPALCNFVTGWKKRQWRDVQLPGSNLDLAQCHSLRTFQEKKKNNLFCTYMYECINVCMHIWTK